MERCQKIHENNIAKVYNKLKDAGVQIIIGPPTSTQAEIVADMAEQDEIVTISYSASSPVLDQYTYFFRTFPSEIQILSVSLDVRFFR